LTPDERIDRAYAEYQELSTLALLRAQSPPVAALLRSWED
jgi:hypothetical protein